jgi:hypothetical protein
MAHTKRTPNLTSAPDSMAVFSAKTLVTLQQSKGNTKNEAAAARVEKTSARKATTHAAKKKKKKSNSQ